MNNSLFILIATLIFSASAQAGDLEWSGVYRIEANHIKNAELDGRELEKNYGTHHLILRPKIVAADGLTIYSQFDIFNSEDPSYENSQFGQVWGSGIGSTSTSSSSSNSTSERQKAESIVVSQLYLTYVQEFGQLLVGRAPLHFGLGITHNAGRGLFDHWYDTRDLVAYKFVLGNFYLMPIFGKVNEGAFNQSDDVTDLMIHLQYENPETDTEMGVMYAARKAGDQGNDVPTSATENNLIGGPGALANRRQSTTSLNVYALRDTERLRIGLEASFLDGDTGVTTAGFDDVSLSGFGLAFETEYRPEDSKWKMGFKGGLASGDDYTTDGNFEGFIFDRNYDVAMLLFNHPLGQADFMRTGSIREANDPTNPATPNAIGQADTEAISNVMYASPYAIYQWKDQLALETSLTTGWLQDDAVLNQKEKDLGYELDVKLHFVPKTGVMWTNQIGLLFPGSAFEGDGTLQSKFMYGVSTKAAISF